ncbi:MAG TPA: ankyrin repeat domain-containing protein [Candidatus Dependentiae bacterium]|nr:ankyrin repeat domain-containing protein [Candidatus Dependentiae bacterium]HRQ62823.1 ankyrin repeat domain-containing protein [Candidatus Dependentiae bacterium]
MRVMFVLCLMLNIVLCAMEKPNLPPFLPLPPEIQLTIIECCIAQEITLLNQVRSLAQLRCVNRDLYNVLDSVSIGRILRFSKPAQDADQVQLVQRVMESEDVSEEDLSAYEFSEDDSHDKQQNPLSPLNTLLFNAIGGHSAVWAAGLLSAKADKDTRDFDDGYTGLHVAVHVGSTSCLLALLNAGADINACNEDGCTPLHVAATQGKLNCLKLLLARGASTECVDGENNTPLDMAMAHKQPACMDELLRAGACHDRIGTDGAHIIHRMAAYGTVDMLNVLLGHEYTYVDITDDDGNTPLHYAAMEGKHANVQALLAEHANSQARNHSGDRPYDLACAYGHSTCAKLLRKKFR